MMSHRCRHHVRFSFLRRSLISSTETCAAARVILAIFPFLLCCLASLLFYSITECSLVLDDLKERGVKEIGLWVSDGNQSTLNAIASKVPSSARQRWVVHKMENVLRYVPNKQREQIEPELKALFYQKNREAADQAVAAFIEKYQKSYPTAMACLQRDLEACLTFYSFSKEHWKTIRTNNIIERLFGEVKRRSHKMASASEPKIVVFYSFNVSSV